MSGTSMVRHCTSCSKDVYNLSMLTEREADAALAVRPDEVCVIYYTDPSGQVVFYPEPPVRRAPGLMLAAALTASALAACSQPAPVELEASRLAVASPRDVQVAISTAPSTTNPAVVAPAQATPTPGPTDTIEGEPCVSDWNKAFDKQNRNDAHTRDRVPKPGGLPRRHFDEDEDPLQGLMRHAPAQAEPDRRDENALPSRDEIVAAFSAVRAAVSSCGGSGVAFANTEFSGKSGRVTSVDVSGVSAKVAVCIEKSVRHAKVPKFTSKSFKVKYPFKLKG